MRQHWKAMTHALATAIRRSRAPLGLGLGGVLLVALGACGPKDNGASQRFDITFKYLSTLTDSQKLAFEHAAARWSDIITGDLPDVMSGDVPAGGCGTNSPALPNQRIDDLLILVTVMRIDGPGQILGTSGPCFIRQDSRLTVIGQMQFDSSDLDVLQFKGQLEPTVLHEMGHVLGYGSLWSDDNYLKNPSLPDSIGADTTFSGTHAQTEFDTAGGTSYTAGGKVPVENSMGGAGTRDGHWRESVFQNELMTGFLNNGPNPLSRVSIASLQDLGYQVDLAAADPYGLPVIGIAAQSTDGTVRAESTDGITLGDDVLRMPIKSIDPEGRVIEVHDFR
jgi:hypothetical protein